MGFFDLFKPKPAAPARPFELTVILGAPAQGKSSLADEWIETWAKERRGAGELAILDPAGVWAERGGQWPDDGPRDVRPASLRAVTFLRALRAQRWRSQDVPPMLLVLDDADAYFDSGKPPEIFRDLFTMFRHWRCDVLIIARRPQDLPKIVFTSARWCALFASREVYSRDYLRQYLGVSIVRQIPREPHRYLLVDVDAQTAELRATKARAARTRADL